MRAPFERTILLRISDALNVTLICATLDATRRGHALVLLEHVLVTAVLDEDVATALSYAERGREAVMAEIEALLSVVPTSGDGSQLPDVKLSPVLCQVLAGARRRSNTRPVVSLVDVLEEMSTLEDSRAGALARELRHALAQPQRPAKGASSTGQEPHPYRSTQPLARVVIWDDPRSTMEQVVRVLCEGFGMSKAEAVHLMLTVHHRGYARVGTFPSEEATELCRKGTALAQSLHMPLRITVETGEDGPALGRLERLKRFFLKDQEHLVLALPAQGSR